MRSGSGGGVLRGFHHNQIGRNPKSVSLNRLCQSMAQSHGPRCRTLPLLRPNISYLCVCVCVCVCFCRLKV